jgi:hypothetical protein
MTQLAEEVARLALAWNDAILAGEDDTGRPDSVLRPGAPESELAALETRIGTLLPPSYRAFLAFSNGAWAKPGGPGLLVTSEDRPEAGMLTAAQVGWLIDKDPDFVEIWTDAARTEWDDQLSDEDYFDYQREQDPAEMRVAALPHLLMVSCFDWGSAVFLNPRAVTAGGEWEAWSFDNTNPGAYRYASFADLLRAELVNLARWAAEEAEGAARAVNEDVPAIEAALAALESGARWEHGSDSLDHPLYRIIDPTPWFARLVRLIGHPDLPIVQAALSAIAKVDTPQALQVLLDMVARDSSAPIVHVVIPRLASDSDPRARRAALMLLSNQPLAAGSLPWADESLDLLWQAWTSSGAVSCLAELTQRGDERAVEPLCAALSDPATLPDARMRLGLASGGVRDPRIIPALVTAVHLGGAHRVNTISKLITLGALDEAESLITAEALADPIEYRTGLERAQRRIKRLRAKQH